LGHWQDMTLCIGAISRRDLAIVTISDLMLSAPDETMSAETGGMKLTPIGTEGLWLSLYAGDSSIPARIHARVEKALINQPQDLVRIEAAFRDAFKAELKRKIEDEMLGPSGLTRGEFMRKGREYFGDEEFVRLYYHMNKIELDTEFLVGGFDIQPTGTIPRLFSLSDPGVTAYRDAQSYCAIGIGSTLANATLTTLPFDPFDSLQNIIYRLCEAKFRGESALGVGKMTFVVVLYPDGKTAAIFPERTEQIRSLWGAKGKPPVPPEAAQLIPTLFMPIGWGKDFADQAKEAQASASIQALADKLKEAD